MKRIYLYLFFMLPLLTLAQSHPDIYSTPLGALSITRLNHASILLKINGKVIYIDPYEQTTNFNELPKADLILITHEHADHFDKKALKKITLASTPIISTSTVAASGLSKVSILNNGDTTHWNNITIEAVPAYNLLHKRADGELYHKKGIGNGYVLSFKTFRLYIAGDTENIPEMSMLKNINVAFLPKNLPYTMTDDQFIEAAKRIHPKILYPYHYFELNREVLSKQLPSDITLK